ncbi:hypothetical protein [Olivibacter sp. XZL3]|uniref:hypothetical protein n=1 Tax=Olivibacter sp. XZL3 TaxID=1735116 RepID=UPI001064F478|nr:hypothetical protein [Olivibacter sp. XZL3]
MSRIHLLDQFDMDGSHRLISLMSSPHGYGLAIKNLYGAFISRGDRMSDYEGFAFPSDLDLFNVHTS